MQTISDNTEKLPILGLGKELYGYINGENFHVCNAEGIELPRKYSNYLILGVYSDCYSIYIYKNTTKLLIVDNNGIIVKNPNQDSPYLDFKRFNDNTIVCISDCVYPKGYKENCNVFHPMEYINFQIITRCIKIINNVAIINGERYYLFSMLGLHFFVDLDYENKTVDEVEKYNIDYLDCRYYILDENGDIVKEWKDKESILYLWQRTDGSFSIIGVSVVEEEECYNANLSYFSIPHEYEQNWQCDYDMYKHQKIWDDENDCSDYPSTTYAEYKIMRFKKMESISFDYEFYWDFKPKWELEQDNKRIKCYQDYRINFDDEHLVFFTDLGFYTFNPNKYNIYKELIDKSDFTCEHYKRIIDFQYKNNLIGYYIEDVHEYDNYEYDEVRYDCKKSETYYLCDILGQPIGEILDNIFSPYTNNIGFPEVYGVMNIYTHTFIIPPLYKKILPLERYLEVQSTPPIISADGSKEPSYLYKDRRGNYVINDNTFYVVELNDWQNEDIVTKGVYCNEKIHIDLGRKEIERIHDNYFTCREDDNMGISLYYYSGLFICNNVKDTEVFNIYSMKGRSDWRGDYNMNTVLLFTYVKAITANGFFLVIDGKIVYESLLDSIRPVVVSNKEIVFVAKKAKGGTGLLSYRNKILTELFWCENLHDVITLSTYNDRSYKIFDTSNRYDDESILYKCGNKFSELQNKYIKEHIHQEFFDENHRQKELYLSNIRIRTNKRLIDGKCQVRSFLIGRYPKDIFGLYTNTEIQQLSNEIDIKDFEKLYIYGHYEIGEKGAILLLHYDDNTYALYDTTEGFIIKYEEKSFLLKLGDSYIFGDGRIANKSGIIIYDEGPLELIDSIDDKAAAFYVPSRDQYIIVDGYGYIRDDLTLIEDGKYIWPNHEKCIEQYILNVPNRKLDHKVIKELSQTTQDDYNEKHYSYCPEWTIEDSWDAMTDGHDVEGAWDNDIFG